MKLAFGALKSIGAMMPMSKSVILGNAASTPAASTVAASLAAWAHRWVAAYTPRPTPGIDQSSVFKFGSYAASSARNSWTPGSSLVVSCLNELAMSTPSAAGPSVLIVAGSRLRS